MMYVVKHNFAQFDFTHQAPHKDVGTSMSNALLPSACLFCDFCCVCIENN